MTIQSYGIVAGWNGTPVNIESVAVAGATPLDQLNIPVDTDTHYFVHTQGRYQVPYVFTGGGVTQNGYAVKTWQLSLVTLVAYNYLITTYAQESSQNGKCTVNTTLNTATYVEKNAYVFAPYPDKLSRVIRAGVDCYQDVEITLRIVGDTV